MADLGIKLLGGFDVSRARIPELAFRTRKAKALLAYLAWPPGRAHARDKLAALLWGESDQDHARKNLRHAVALLRKAVSDRTAGIIIGAGDSLYLDPDDAAIDAVEFDALIARGTTEALEKAMEMYRGEFLDGFELKDAAFVEWVTTERAQLREKALAALSALMDHYIGVGDIEQGVQVALRLLGYDPLQESVHGALIRLYLQQGRRGAALRQYAACREALARELGIEPGTEVEGLYQAIRQQATSRVASTGTSKERGPWQVWDVSPFVGREHEMGLVLECWQRAKDGEGQVVHLTGEAGIGKSRIIDTLCERIADESHVRLRYQGSPVHRNSAFYPITVQLAQAAGFTRDDTPREKLTKLEALLGLSSDRSADTLTLFAGLLSIPIDDDRPQSQLSAKRIKEQTVEALLAQLFGLAAQQPVLVIVEDAQWIDPSTEELLEQAIARSQNTRSLFVIAYRPEYDPPWAGHVHVTTLTLGQLSRRQAAILAEEVARSAMLRSELNDKIVARTDGVPLFIEELTKAALESTGLFASRNSAPQIGALSNLAVPASLTDSLATRLGHLGPAKEVAQAASVIGRAFSTDLLADLMPLDEGALEDALNVLMTAQLVFRRSAKSPRSYFFKHALVQEAAYGGLPTSERKRLHGTLAESMLQRHPEIADSEPEVLAHHFTEAGLMKQAARYWLRASRRAAERSAHLEAIAHSAKGLEIVGKSAGTSASARLELELYLTLGTSLISTKGYAAPEVGQAYTRARALCEQICDTAQLFPVLFGQWLNTHQTGRSAAARGLAQEALSLAEEQGDPGILLQAHHATWTTLLTAPELSSCLHHAEQGVALYDRDRHRSHAIVYGGHDPGVCGWNHVALCRWFLGYPEQAAKASRTAIELAKRLAHPFSQVLALAFSGFLNQHRRDPDATRECAEAVIDLCAEQGVAPHYAAIGRILRGWAMATEGDVEGPAEIRQGVDAWQEMGAKVRLGYLLGVLAEAFGRARQPDEGLDAVEEALGVVEASGEGRWEPELFRLKGELLLSAVANKEEAEVCFDHAIEMARQLGAKSLELRATTSLARLRHSQGRNREARDALAPIYGWFEEGFDAPDLKDAKTLLAELYR